MISNSWVQVISVKENKKQVISDNVAGHMDSDLVPCQLHLEPHNSVFVEFVFSNVLLICKAVLEDACMCPIR